MRNLLWAVLVLTGLAACVKHNSKECNVGVCSDAELPFCDSDGSIAGTPNTCIAVTCTPGMFEACRGDEIITCNADGSNYDVSTCNTGCDEAAMSCKACTPNTATCSDERTLETCGPDGTSTSSACDVGCVDGEQPHCAYLELKYLPDVCDQRAPSPSLAITSSGSFDTSLDNNCNGGILSQASAPDICIVRYGKISIASDAVLTVTGSRVLALVADDALTIDGVVDGGAKQRANGPGGGFIVSGFSTEGAGFHTNGGRTALLVNSTGGPAQPNPATQTVLLGGTAASTGGGGGGAVMLAACRGPVTVAGTVASGGGGGPGGVTIAGKVDCGMGGGSGGNIVLQGVSVAITGQLFANGGGGGGGVPVGQSSGPAGQDGQFTDVFPANGGMSPPAPSGGSGGLLTQRPGSGSGASSGGGCSAGGGSDGFVQTYTPQGSDALLMPSHVAPALGANGTVQTK